MKKGFTLIELLAVIVILAIVALIATPILLNIIKDSKEQANIISASNYIQAVEEAIAVAELDITKQIPDGIYYIMDDGNLCSENETTACTGIKVNVKISGTIPESGQVVIKNGKVVANDEDDENIITSIVIDNIAYGFVDNKLGKLSTSTPEYITDGLVVDVDIENYNGGSTIANKIEGARFTSFNIEGTPQYDGEYIRVNKTNSFLIPYVKADMPITIEIVAHPEANTNVAYYGFGSTSGATRKQHTISIMNNKILTWPLENYYNSALLTTRHSLTSLLSNDGFYNGRNTIYQNANIVANNILLDSANQDVGRMFETGIRIGSRDLASNYIKIYAVRVYNKHLTSEEIQHNYSVDKIRFGI